MSDHTPYPVWGAPQQPRVPEGRNGFAVAGLVLGIIPFMGGLLGIVFGAIGLSQTRRTGQRGRAMATAGLVLGSLWMLLVVGAVAASVMQDADRDDAGAVTTAGTESAYDLAVGDCLPDVPSGPVDTVDLVPCSEQHAVEVYAEFDLAGGRFPGEDRVSELAEAGCASRFRGFAGVELEESPLDVHYLQPLEQGWELDRDRTVTCMVVSGPDGAQEDGGTLGA